MECGGLTGYARKLPRRPGPRSLALPPVRAGLPSSALVPRSRSRTATDLRDSLSACEAYCTLAEAWT